MKAQHVKPYYFFVPLVEFSEHRKPDCQRGFDDCDE